MDKERLPLNLVISLRIHEKFRADQQTQVSGVELGNQHLLVTLYDLSKVLREGIHVPQMRMGDRFSLLDAIMDGRADGPVGASPTEDEQLARRRAFDLLQRDVIGDAGDFV